MEKGLLSHIVPAGEGMGEGAGAGGKKGRVMIDVL